MFWLVGVGSVVTVGALWAVALHNGLVHLRNDIDRAWANVDVLLLQRADEIPNLVAVCRGYAAHERGVIDAVLRARDALRAAAGPVGRGAAQEALNGALLQVFGLAEAYPALRADAVYANLMRRISALEDEIADRRELYNACVARYNTRLGQIPDLWIARFGGQQPRPLFTAAARALPSIASAGALSPPSRAAGVSPRPDPARRPSRR